MKGLRLSGESIAFFARGRIAHLRDWWLAAGRSEPRRIVDYGCGTGAGTALLPEFFPHAEVVGVDSSSAYIDEARERHRGERLRFGTVGEADAEPADLVHVNGVLHHVEPAQRESFLRDSAGLVRDGGVFALFENNPANPGTRMVMNRIAFDRDAVPIFPGEARRRLRDAELTIACTRFLFFFPRPLRALRVLEPWLAAVPLGAQYAVFATREAPEPPFDPAV
jgi:trans-aconitate methyltransferase